MKLFKNVKNEKIKELEKEIERLKDELNEFHIEQYMKQGREKLRLKEAAARLEAIEREEAIKAEFSLFSEEELKDEINELELDGRDSAHVSHEELYLESMKIERMKEELSRRKKEKKEEN